jgi:hypothetical protein
LLNYFWKKLSCIAGFVLVALLSLSPTTQATEENIESSKALVRIGVISFQPLIPEEGLGNTVICPLCSMGYSSGRILKGAEKIVEDIFVEKLRELKEIQIIPPDKVRSVYKRISSESLKKPLLEVLKKVGNELGADALALGYIYRYTERVGYDYSSEHPASVAFEIYMIKPIDGSTIWRGIFDKTQKSLMEDLFQISSFYKGGGKWLTAQQLSKQGMDEIFETFPGFVR